MDRKINLAALINHLVKNTVCPSESYGEVAIYALRELTRISIFDKGVIPVVAMHEGVTNSLQTWADPGYLAPDGRYKPCVAAGCDKCYKTVE